MKKIRIILPVLLAGMMILSACAGAGTDPNANEGVETIVPNMDATLTPVEQPTLFPTEIASATAAPTEVTSTPLATLEQPTPTSIVGIPPTGGDLEALSAMLRYRMVDNAGNELGMARDFIVNTCQAHILYIVLDAPTGEQSILLPYEAVSLNMDRPEDAATDELVVNIDASQLASVPTIDLRNADFESATWDSAVMNYWKQHIAISLTSACNVAARATLTPTLTPSLVPSLTPGGTVSPTVVAPSASPEPTDAVPSETPVASGYHSIALQTTPTAPITLTPSTQVAGTPTITSTPVNRTNVYKLVQASDLIGINVVDVRNNTVAKVRDALVLKSTGAVYYLIVQLVAGNQQDANGNLVAVPLGAVNLFYGTDDFLRSTQVNPTATPVSGTPSAPAAGTPDTGKRVDTPADRLERPVLVLLVDLSVLQNAPAYSSQNGFVGEDTFNYWSNVFPSTPKPTLTPTP